MYDLTKLAVEAASAFVLHVRYITSDLKLCMYVGHKVVSRHEALDRARRLDLDLVEVMFSNIMVFF